MMVYKSILIITLTVFSLFRVTAQEEITPLFSNSLLQSGAHYKSSAVTIIDTLQLPFLDDFSTSRHFPDSLLWTDKDVFINSTFPVSPPTIGVATFDGLNDYGFAYVPNQNTSYGRADYLSSHCIDLEGKTAADSIYLSFAYQPEGIGNAPQSEDSLVVEFSLNDTLWTHVWSVPGTSLKGFRFATIPVTDTLFFRKDFRFRFMNYSTLSGSFDHWHVDYVYLNSGRFKADTVFQDVAFTSRAKPLLKTYSEMPWNHYNANELKDSLVIPVKNNYIQAANVPYQYIIRNDQGTIIAQSTGLSGNINPDEVIIFKNKISSLAFTGAGPYEEFLIENIISPSPDFNRKNDTVRQYQRFDQHFAYDDGSAEAGYSLNAFGAQLAYKFHLNVTDVLTGVAMNWNFADNDMTFAGFRFTVWADDNGKPGSIIYMKEDSVWYPQYNGVNGFVQYNLYDQSFSLNPGTYHFGWIQVDNSRLNVGFDLNTNNSNKIHFNVQGTWEPSATLKKGSLLIRPLFGQPNLPISTEQINGDDAEVKMYPNPADQYFKIESSTQLSSISVFDVSGRLVYEGQEKTISTSTWQQGIYFVQVRDFSGSVQRFKLVVRR